MYRPADLANRALDAMGSERSIGDLQDGSREAQVLLRSYGECLRQLLRAANWGFARKTMPLTLLGDSTGNTPNVGTIVAAPWLYAYAYPPDCMKVRFIPQNTVLPSTPAGNYSIPTNIPLMPGLTTLSRSRRVRPARFLIATDTNYPAPDGENLAVYQGVSPGGRTVVLTDVQQAQIVYTALVVYPQLWDALFRDAFVAYLSSQTVMAIIKDKKFALEMRSQQIALAKQKISEARAIEGNEATTSSDIPVDWMNRRVSGAYQGYGRGEYGGGDDSCQFADGSAF